VAPCVFSGNGCFFATEDTEKHGRTRSNTQIFPTFRLSVFPTFFQFKNSLTYAPKTTCHMIKFSDIKIGDYVLAEYDGKMWEGEVVRLNGDEKQVCVQTDVQEFWFSTDQLHPLPLNEDALLKLSFAKQPNEDGSVKYMKGSFRLVTPQSGDFSKIEMWYREDRRHHPDVHYVHQLQNHYLDMTKIHLTRDPM